MHDVAAALADEEPLALLALVSSLLAALEPPRHSPFAPSPDPELPSREELVATFMDVELEETSALLTAIAALSDDEMLRRRVRREIVRRAHTLPRWLVELDRAEPVERAVEVTHVLGDGDNVVVGARLAGGHELVAVVYIDHNLGTLVKDAFVLPGPLGAVVEQISAAADDPDVCFRDLSPGDARTRISEAVEFAAITWPPLESETWPACRPLVEWIVRMLPEGGTGYQRPEWDDGDREELAERFLASVFGSVFDDADHRMLLDSLLWFGTDYGPGDPLRWSPTAVEILLLDWVPRKIVAPAAHLSKTPDLLRAFIRFAHSERGLRPGLTEQTLAAVEVFEPDFQSAIRSPRPQGPAALLAAMGMPEPEGGWFADMPVETHDIMLDALRRAVGGEAALDRLDAEPLPDEPFEWAQLPADVHDRVAEVLALVDRCCEALFDTEYRTASRRFLARAAAGDPEIFRRRGRAPTAAAAVCWVIGKANRAFEGDVLVRDLMAHFGLGQGSASQRSAPLLRAIGVDPDQQYGGMDLGSPDYLVSTRRAEIVAARDRYREMAAAAGSASTPL
jgi:hypothetical protein